MSDPIRTFDNLKSAYLRYFDSAFDLRFEEIVRARAHLLDRDGVLYRESLVEPQPPYAGSGKTYGPPPNPSSLSEQDGRRVLLTTSRHSRRPGCSCHAAG